MSDNAGFRLSLRPLLYSGGASAKANEVEAMIEKGQLGNPRAERVELLARLRLVMLGDLNFGRTQSAAMKQVRLLRQLFAFADWTGRPLSAEMAISTYRAWAASLQQTADVQERMHASSSVVRRGTLPAATTAYPDTRCIEILLHRTFNVPTARFTLNPLNTADTRPAYSRALAEHFVGVREQGKLGVEDA
jgi:hypothetical protein